ncbi:hypothetical protein BCR41DRAFT_129165 [Lobosporangium transversale]|uniref:Uncharacterized protein n=1 Tax=Lobosporangium transversale TaxID=64571 RepID=A0A1Y2GL78_9FUNG|nr:hypothetical protein BCR41DRAFT_129165 [Lobosporangium transversale]ORZ10681.1 hypothetical protein BCR41DRAFT_129165 [Lobosporangium transversale]|eukprot:XP_021879402.1 hypothetical protein BCR41DRAFT_129165 [Lobosporangium transversale]
MNDELIIQFLYDYWFFKYSHQNMDGAQHGSSRGPYPMDMPQRPTVTIKTNSADKVMLMEKKTSLYAGPTFHNSPAPTSLPIPAFSRSAGNSPTEPTVDRLPSSPFFAEAASPQLNSMRPFTVPSPTEGWTGHYSMPLTHGYNVPDRMATSSFTPHGPAPDSVAHLMEISQSLRNLLKIQSQ